MIMGCGMMPAMCDSDDNLCYLIEIWGVINVQGKVLVVVVLTVTTLSCLIAAVGLGGIIWKATKARTH
jgi:hypothetical protein